MTISSTSIEEYYPQNGASVADPPRHEKFERLVAAAQRLPAVTTAVVHPCDDVSLGGAIEAARLKLIVPILVGPTERIQQIAARAGLDIRGLEIVDAAYSHEAAAKGVELVRSGRAEALMKGSLHTDELLGAVVARAKQVCAPPGASAIALSWTCPVSPMH